MTTASKAPPKVRGDSVKAAVAERPARLRLVADHGRLLPRERAVPRHQPREQALPRHLPRERAVPRHPSREQAILRHPSRERAVPRREPARRIAARPGRIPSSPVPERTPIRLTRRGRAVVAAAVVLLVGVVSLALVLWVLRG